MLTWDNENWNEWRTTLRCLTNDYSEYSKAISSINLVVEKYNSFSLESVSKIIKEIKDNSGLKDFVVFCLLRDCLIYDVDQ